jgi:hypothetical protein
MAREITDSDGTVWTCVQAYAGLQETSDRAAEYAEKTSETCTVVCTPSGGAQSVRLELESDWESLPDEELKRAIEA